jgi:hypothetical protein
VQAGVLREERCHDAAREGRAFYPKLRDNGERVMPPPLLLRQRGARQKRLNIYVYNLGEYVYNWRKISLQITYKDAQENEPKETAKG